ncbi:hypothetical protein ACQPT2_16860 [Erwinia amylovora]
MNATIRPADFSSVEMTAAPKKSAEVSTEASGTKATVMPAVEAGMHQMP